MMLFSVNLFNQPIVIRRGMMIFYTMFYKRLKITYLKFYMIIMLILSKVTSLKLFGKQYV